MSIPQAINHVQTLSTLPGGVDQSRGSPYMSGAMPQVLRPSWGIPPTVTFNPADASAVRVGGIWLFPETVNSLSRAPWSQSPLDIARAAVSRGLNRMTELPHGMLTQHALMVAWGEFAHEIGLIEKLSRVPIP